MRENVQTSFLLGFGLHFAAIFDQKAMQKDIKKDTEKGSQKDTGNEKEIVERKKEIDQRNPSPPPTPYPGRATPAHPQSRLSAKAQESLLKLFCCGMLYPLCARTPDRRILIRNNKCSI